MESSERDSIQFLKQVPEDFCPDKYNDKRYLQQFVKHSQFEMVYQDDDDAKKKSWLTY